MVTKERRCYGDHCEELRAEGMNSGKGMKGCSSAKDDVEREQLQVGIEVEVARVNHKRMRRTERRERD